MEYVVYLSKSKIDMLYGQISKKSFKYSLAGKLGVGALKLEASKNGNTEIDYYQKLEKVISKIPVVNSIFEDNAQYITGTMSMYWGMLKRTDNATFWVGNDNNGICHSKILLIGSSQHIIGNTPNVDGVHCSPLVYFLHAYHKELEFNGHFKKIASLHKESNIHDIISAMEMYCESEGLQVQSPYRFLAKCLSQEFYTREDGTSENLIIATPLYVSNI